MDINNVTKEEVESMLMSYQHSPTIDRLNDYFNERSFMEILHVERKENYHSNFLKWVFEDKELYENSLRLLLLLLLKRSRQLKGTHFPDEVSRALLTNSFNIDSVSAELEDSIINTEGKGRCDIRLIINHHFRDGQPKKLYVLIENKVFSDEHKVGKTGIYQTKFYYDHYCKEYGEENCVFAYLNLIDSQLLQTLTESQCHCKAFIQINYQDLLDWVFSVMVSAPSLSTRNHFILNEYIKGLSFQNNNSVMAMEQSLIDLLVSFWDNNNELIKLSIAALAISPNTDEEFRQQVKEVNDQIQALAAKRDTTHYKFNGEDYKGKSALVYGILEFLISKKNTAAINEDWLKFLNKNCKGTLDDFDEKLNWTIKKHVDGSDPTGCNKALGKELKGLKKQKLIYTESEFDSAQIKSKDHNYSSKLFKNNNTYRCYNQWGWGNIDYVIKFFREHPDNMGLQIELL